MLIHTTKFMTHVRLPSSLVVIICAHAQDTCVTSRTVLVILINPTLFLFNNRTSSCDRKQYLLWSHHKTQYYLGITTVRLYYLVMPQCFLQIQHDFLLWSSLCIMTQKKNILYISENRKILENTERGSSRLLGSLIRH